MKKVALISILFMLTGCTMSLKTETKKDDLNISVEKEIFIGPKIGKQ